MYLVWSPLATIPMMSSDFSLFWTLSSTEYHHLRCVLHDFSIGCTFKLTIFFVASQGLSSTQAARAAENIANTLVECLSAGVGNVDVQLLYDPRTEKLIFIDFTEARIFRQPPDPLDLSVASDFVTEMASVVPESATHIFRKQVELNLQRVELDDNLRSLLQEIVTSSTYKNE